ncbi:MAG TPA: hypothetical protein VIK04_17240, partial [Solirubrobacteraceae bacterium]
MGLGDGVVDGTDATVEVGVAAVGFAVTGGVGAAGALGVVDVLAELELKFGAGDGETIEADVVVLDDDVVADDNPADVVPVCASGLEDSLGSPPANGSRGRLASSVLTDTVGAALPVVPACALGRADAPAGIGAGVAAAVPVAGAPLRSSSGTAMMARSSTA